MSVTDNLITLPNNAGRKIIEAGAVIACPLLDTERFVKFCKKDCGLSVSRERLIRLERLRLFTPIFRVRKPERDAPPPFYILVRKGHNWFTKKWAWDTTGLTPTYQVPDYTDGTQEGYYSIFQIDYLHMVLQRMTDSVELDYYLDRIDKKNIDWHKKGERRIGVAESRLKSLLTHEYHRRSVALLCQFISNRYYPKSQSDQRKFRNSLRRGIYPDHWYEWDPRKAERLFDLTPEKLRNAYKGLALAQKDCDPLERWYQLTQFVAVKERKKLKGDALRAETLRAGAHMLRLLYKDLYGEELPHPNEEKVITHIPELDVRQDTRRYLELVVNRFGLNPQPKLCLIVEGESEEAAVQKIFKQYFGAHPGKYWIEIVVLGGVGVATGTKQDRFRAILRLVDYLHHHQTITFLILDNENYAIRLEQETKKAKSIHSDRRYVTRPDYIKIWRKSFEFDNFSCSEIAAAMSKLAMGHANFTTSEVATCKKNPNPGASLKHLYKQKTHYGLQKIKLSEFLVEHMMSPSSRRKIENRPIVKVLERVRQLADDNLFPTMHKIWEDNQASNYFGKKLKRSRSGGKAKG
ncbi:MAG TPA: hypothetical protein ENJ37_05320 [Deltaproteobacteria bacterium]|nr:hypothetical protein [Deltaproteobacteria bacterium]